MARYYRTSGHRDRFQVQDHGTGWVVSWETHKIADDGRWSAASAGSEEDALKRAQHFLKLGFVVHAITDPLGSVFMDEHAIACRFGAAPDPRAP